MFWIERRTWGSRLSGMVGQSNCISFRGCCPPTKEVRIMQLAKNSVGCFKVPPGETSMLRRTVTGDRAALTRRAKDD